MVIVDGIKFYDSGNGYLKSQKVGWLHRYVWEKHNGPIPKGFIIHHKDHNKLNNDISNLELMEERAHRKNHGVRLNKPLTMEEYTYILELHTQGYSNSKISEMIGRGYATIYDCISGRRNKKFLSRVINTDLND